MGKKIITMLSAPPQKKPRRMFYLAPDGKKYMGIQTNDAPLRYLLYHHGSDVDEIRCLVTPEAQKTYERLKTLYCQRQYFQKWEFEMQEISFPMEQESQQTVLPRILEGLQEGDEILLDTTGGFRNVVMYLLLLSRILSYRGIHVIEAVYGNYQTHQIEDVTPMYQMFELVGGMQEMASFGSIATLQRYYAAQEADPVVVQLLDAMQQLKESINLCRTESLPQQIRQFQQALTAAESHSTPMMEVLLPVFRKKFGENMDILQLIRWCLQSDMLQQALTIYVECVPEYLYGPNGLIQREWALPVLKRPYENPNKAQLTSGILALSSRCQNRDTVLPSKEPRWPEGYEWYKKIDDMQQLKRTLENSCNLLMDIFSGTYQDLRELFPARMLENLSVVANLAFGPGGTGPYQSEWVQRLPSNREYLGKLCSYFDAKQYHSMLEFLQNAHLCNDKMLKLLLQSPDLEQYSSQGKKAPTGRVFAIYKS